MSKRWLLALLGLALLVFVAPAAYADDVAQAEALFNAARDLRDAGKYAEACPKFEASFKLDKQLGTLINIGDCYEKLGRWATAWARYDAAIEWAQQDNDDRLAFIQEGKDRVAPKVPKLILRVSNPDPTLELRQDGSKVLPAMYGVALPVDPGTVTVEVWRGVTKIETLTSAAIEGQTSELAIDLAAIAAAHPIATPAPDPVVTPAPDPVPDTPAEPYDPTLRTIGLIVGGVGLSAVLVASGLEIGALVKKGQAESDDACVNKFCSPDGLADADTAATLAEVGQWVGIAGLVTLAVGATIFLVSPSEPDDDVSVALTPALGPAGGGLTLEGRF